MRAILLSLSVLCLAGCGATVGDACTTSADCGGAICPTEDWAPGGYCTRECNRGAPTCPVGTVCVDEALGKNRDGCMRECFSVRDCRNGYTCRSIRGSGSVCVGPSGL